MQSFSIPATPDQFVSLEWNLLKVATVNKTGDYTGTVTAEKKILWHTIQIEANYIYDPAAKMLTVDVAKGPADRIKEEIEKQLSV